MSENYGHPEQLEADIDTLHDILDRQGSSLLINAIADNVACTAIKFNMSEQERDRLTNSLAAELQNALLEKLHWEN